MSCSICVRWRGRQRKEKILLQRTSAGNDLLILLAVHLLKTSLAVWMSIGKHGEQWRQKEFPSSLPCYFWWWHPYPLHWHWEALSAWSMFVTCSGLLCILAMMNVRMMKHSLMSNRGTDEFLLKAKGQEHLGQQKQSRIQWFLSNHNKNESFGWYVLTFSVAARLWQHLIVKVKKVSDIRCPKYSMESFGWYVLTFSVAAPVYGNI